MRRIGWLWPAQAFCADLILIYPVYAIMMQDAGVTGIELSGLFILWSLAALLFEIPSGVIGDLLNRKLYIGVGAGIKTAAYITWLPAPGRRRNEMACVSDAGQSGRGSGTGRFMITLRIAAGEFTGATARQR